MIKIGIYVVKELLKVAVKSVGLVSNGELEQTSVVQPLQGGVELRRGGDWQKEGNQSVFHFKVKVRNNTGVVMTDVNIVLDSVPAGLHIEKRHQIFGKIKNTAEVSPLFKFIATDNCVGDTISGFVTYRDPVDEIHTVPIEPFEIKYVCNLLRPVDIGEVEFEQQVHQMVGKPQQFYSIMPMDELKEQIRKVILECNFSLIKRVEAVGDKNTQDIEAFAQGLYDRQSVALSVGFKQLGDRVQVNLNVLSERQEKIMDLQKNISERLDGIKDDMSLFKEYGDQLAELLDSYTDMEAYLREHLASDWENVKDSWAEFNVGKITGKELVWRGIKGLSKKFVKVIIGRITA